MLVSPQEPAFLRNLGPTSSVPEQFGSDFLMYSPTFGTVGIQRKELKDLVQSLNDDRLAREVIAMKELDCAIWIIEGNAQWSSEGQLMLTPTRYTLSEHLGLMFSLSFQGFLLFSTSTITDTGVLLSRLESWLQKEKHRGTNSRKQPRGLWGKPDTQEWQIHFLQGLPGLGIERARAIVSHFNGLPLKLTGDLSEVDGVGSKTNERIRRLFE